MSPSDIILSSSVVSEILLHACYQTRRFTSSFVKLVPVRKVQNMKSSRSVLIRSCAMQAICSTTECNSCYNIVAHIVPADLCHWSRQAPHLLAGGFGKGNFGELFKSIEDYERTLSV